MVAPKRVGEPLEGVRGHREGVRLRTPHDPPTLFILSKGKPLREAGVRGHSAQLDSQRRRPSSGPGAKSSSLWPLPAGSRIKRTSLSTCSACFSQLSAHPRTKGALEGLAIGIPAPPPLACA